MKTDIQTELTQALLSHEKVWANEEKTILAKNILLDLVEKPIRPLSVCYWGMMS